MNENNTRNAILTEKGKKTRKRNKITAKGGVAVIRGCAETKMKRDWALNSSWGAYGLEGWTGSGRFKG